MMVIRRGNEHGVALLAELVEHLPVIGENLKLARVAAFVRQQFSDGLNPFLVHVHDGDEIFIEGCFEVLHRAAAAADLDAADLLTGIGGMEDVERRSGKDTGGKGAPLQEGTTSQLGLHGFGIGSAVLLRQKLSDVSRVSQQKH